jgi:hypothetical protein
MVSHTALFNHPSAGAGWAQTTPPKDATRLPQLDAQVIFQRPSNGRNTRLGRRVEKPGDAHAAGPSGQHEATDHERKHTNK